MDDPSPEAKTEDLVAAYPVSLPAWRTAKDDLGVGKRRRFPFRCAPREKVARPILFVRAANGHAPKQWRLVPALVDSGAHVSVAPRRLADALGHDFARGQSCEFSSGIGGQSGRVFAHRTNLAVLEPTETAGPEDIAFGPLVTSLRFMEGDLPFLLLGQRDFLRYFAFHQVPKRGVFELQWMAE